MSAGSWGSAIAPQVSVVFCPEYSARTLRDGALVCWRDLWSSGVSPQVDCLLCQTPWSLRRGIMRRTPNMRWDQNAFQFQTFLKLTQSLSSHSSSLHTRPRLTRVLSSWRFKEIDSSSCDSNSNSNLTSCVANSVQIHPHESKRSLLPLEWHWTITNFSVLWLLLSPVDHPVVFVIHLPSSLMNHFVL